VAVLQRWPGRSRAWQSRGPFARVPSCRARFDCRLPRAHRRQAEMLRPRFRRPAPVCSRTSSDAVRWLRPTTVSCQASSRPRSQSLAASNVQYTSLHAVDGLCVARTSGSVESVYSGVKGRPGMMQHRLASPTAHQRVAIGWSPGGAPRTRRWPARLAAAIKGASDERRSGSRREQPPAANPGGAGLYMGAATVNLSAISRRHSVGDPAFEARGRPR
jgi:hypothetical protein